MPAHPPPDPKATAALAHEVLRAIEASPDAVDPVSVAGALLMAAAIYVHRRPGFSRDWIRAAAALAWDAVESMESNDGR
jgi:hypothetical protein